MVGARRRPIPGSALRESIGLTVGARRKTDSARTGEPVGLNFQNRDGFIPPCQARQLIAMIEKYGDIK